MRRIRVVKGGKTHKVSKDWSFGLFVAGAVAAGWIAVSGSFPWWMLVICVVIAAVVEVLTTGSSTDEEQDAYVVRK